MKSPNIRQNFYQGQNILAKDLNALQDYSDTNKNLLVSELLGSGILHGFEITKKEGFTISISPGVAFDKNGTRLNLEESTDITLTPLSPTTDKRLRPILLGIKLSYIASEPIKDSVDNETPTILTPSVEIVTGENLDEGVFQLAVITLGKSAIIDITRPTNMMLGFTYPQRIKDLLYPIGYQYTQYPNDTTGLFREEDSPCSLFGGDWEKQFETESVFFRTEGSLANESRSSGLQLDAMQKMTSKLDLSVVTDTTLNNTEWAGVMRVSGLFSVQDFYATIPNRGFSKLEFDNSQQARTATENRPVNMLMIIWKRI